MKTCTAVSPSLSPPAVSIPVPVSLSVPPSIAHVAKAIPLSIPRRSISHAINLDRYRPPIEQTTTDYLATSNRNRAVLEDGEEDADDDGGEGEGDGAAVVIEEIPPGTHISMPYSQLYVMVHADVISFNVQ